MALGIACVRAATPIAAEASAEQVESILQSRSRKVKAAHDFAASLAESDEAKAIQRFAAAYHLADSSQQPPTAAPAPTPSVAVKPSLWQKAALTSRVFQQNFVKTLEGAIQGTSVVGDPVPVGWRIINGQTTDAFTDCVAVGRDHHFFCSGTVIGKRAVLTAGHCVTKFRPDMVLLGPSINDGTTIEVLKTIPHPQLNLGAHPYNDLSLLILKNPVPDNVTVRSIATEDELYRSYQVTVVGFGSDTSSGSQGFGLKRSADVPIVTYDGSQPDGAKPFGCDLGLEFAASALEIFRPLIVAPGKNGDGAGRRHQDTCNGDSGGPAYVRGPGDTWVLAGATSRPISNTAEYLAPGEKPTSCGDGGIYVRVDKYWQAWIEQTISDAQANLP